MVGELLLLLPVTVNSTELLDDLASRLWDLANDAAADLAAKASSFPAEPNAPPPLQGRLLVAFDELPDSNLVAKFVRDVLGKLPAGDKVRLHGWERAPGGAKGVALAASEGNGRAVLAVTPGEPPKIDVVVTAGSRISAQAGAGPWKATVEVSSDAVWDTELSPTAPPSPPVGTATITARRDEKLTIGQPQGPGVSVEKIAAALVAGPAAPLSFELKLEGFRAALLPEQIAAFLGAGPERSTTGNDLRILADAADGLRFDGSGLRVELPVSFSLPAVSVRGFAVELDAHPDGLRLKPTIGLLAELPGLPVHAELDDLGIDLPLSLTTEALGPLVAEIAAKPPAGIGIELTLPPVSGGGAVRSTGPGAYAGILDIDLGVLRVQALGLVQMPENGNPTSILALLAAIFPFPGIQIGFGFAIDAVGGLLGINRRVDTEQLRTLVADGNADRVLFPGNAVSRAEEITDSLGAAFPVSRGRFVVGPMVRINWGGRLVTISGAVVIDLPGPAQIVLLGRLLVALPDPEAPLIRLQASVLGRIDPAIPETELLVSLTGSWIVTMPISGEIYLLARGGDEAVFVLSAGGFHPRYTKPAGVPELKRLSIDLGGGYLGLRAEAYLAVTSNAMMFGANLHLDATIAGCGVEGQLSLDALFVWEPTFSFSVHVHASVAVLAFGHRLANVGLDFTLEGPGLWRAFGTGSISILFWDVSLDFDVRWGDAHSAVPAAPEIRPLLEEALARPDAWTAERPLEQRHRVRLSNRAKADLASGAAVQADATLRVSQRVVPLGEPIARFARTKVPGQRWDMTTGGPPVGDAVTERFVPGEFFDLSADQQLVSPAFQQAKSGVSLSDGKVATGPFHLVDDMYETGYKVENGFQTQAAGISLNPAIGHFAREGFARLGGSDERLARWRSAQQALSSRKVLVR
jgi:hypothetical protein